MEVLKSCERFASERPAVDLHRLVRPWVPLRGSYVLGCGPRRWLLVRDVDHTAPLPVGVHAPDCNSSKMRRDRRAVRTWHGEVVSAADVGELAVGREYRLFRYPVDFETRRL